MDSENTNIRLDSATATMDSENTNIPEEYVDMLVQEFAYDPIRLPLAEDRTQVLYNRRTLENIWDAKHEAVNPFTRQPFDINNVIPQADLRQEMHQYIVNRSNVALSLKVIPDYTQVLSEREMIIFLNELISDLQCLINAEENRDPQAAHYWKGLWQKLNLLRLYCQYRPENREVFDSIRGYDLLFKVVDEWFHLLYGYCFSSSCNDANECFKEVAKIVDVIDLKDRNLPPDFLAGLVCTLQCLLSNCEHHKIQGMVLRIYRRIFYDLNIETHLRSRVDSFFISTVFIALYTLARQNRSDISNEDLYNGLAILRATWVESQNIPSCVMPDKYVGVLVNSVILCISRIHDLHKAAKNDDEVKRRMKMQEKNGDEDEAGKNDDEAKNGDEDEAGKNEDEAGKNDVELLSVALERGLWLLNSIVTVTSDEERENPFLSEARKTLRQSDIVSEIVRMVELVLAGLKWLRSTHLQFGINIVAALLKEEGFERRNDVVRVFGDFLGSDILDKYGSHVKLLLQDIMHTANVSDQ